jgi:hypothetical protein
MHKGNVYQKWCFRVLKLRRFDKDKACIKDEHSEIKGQL